LPATPENVQWGWYDPAERPKLVVNSGDTVSIETLSHSLGQTRPGVEMDAIVKLRKENDGGGPHSIKIEIQPIVRKDLKTDWPRGGNQDGLDIHGL
jgi:hypothetical protein